MNRVSRAIITDEEGRVLLGKKSQGIGQGLYTLIGGKPDKGETAEEAIIREVKEEVGLDFSPVFYLEEIDASLDPINPWEVTYYTGKVVGKLKLKKDEVRDVIYISEKDLARLPIAFNQKEKIAEYFRSRKEA